MQPGPRPFVRTPPPPGTRVSVCLSGCLSGHPATAPPLSRWAGEPGPPHDTLSLRCNRMDSYQSVLSVVTVCQAASACWRSRTSVSAW